MKPAAKIKRLFAESKVTVGSDVDKRMCEDALSAFDEFSATKAAVIKPISGRIIMKRKMAPLAAVALIIVAAALSMMFLQNATERAYAIEQTVEALKNVRFMHIVTRDDAGRLKDERWIELGMDGFQIRYRQENGEPWNFGVIEDGESTAVYRNDKKAVVIYDRKDKQFQWIGELGKAFENLRREGKILRENDRYKGQPAHKVWWPMLSSECYVDPASKLPIAMGRTELNYEEPPAGTFEIVVPEGYTVLDRRPGAAAAPVPDWLLEEVNVDKDADKCFREATYALARGEYAEAAELLEFVVQHQAGRNWAWFWLGSAYYGMGQYEPAIEKFTKVLDIFKAYGGGGDKPLAYCNFTRGLAYARLGMDEAAKADLQACLPSMIRTLRLPSAGAMFEYADNPMVRYREYNPSEREIVVNMINRLRLITGENFGYDPGAEDNEQAIAAWERWLEDSGQISFSPDTEILVISDGTPGADG